MVTFALPNFKTMKKSKLILALCLACIVPLLSFSIKTNVRTAVNEKFVKSMFMTGNPPFSFRLDGKHSNDFIRSWSRKFEKSSHSGNSDKYIVTMTSPDKRLSVRTEIITYTDFPAIEWTLNLINNSSENSPRISAITPANFDVTGKEDFTIYTAQGCHAIDRDFHLLKYNLRPDSTYYFEPTGGRPSSKTAFPFYNISTNNGKNGVFMSIGWTGNWFASFRTDHDKLKIEAGMPKTDLYLYPGEQIRTPLISVLYWNGDNRIDGNNEFRRFVLAHHSPKGSDGKMIAPPLCSGFDYGDPAPCGEYEAFTDLFAKAVVDRHKRFGLMPEVFWLDAGWYKGNNAPQSSFEGRNWYNTVGSWEADTSRFPGGLKAIADDVHNNGAQFMVWFEPERVYDGSSLQLEHPEWLLTTDRIKGHNLFNMADTSAVNYLCHYIGDFLENNGIDHYRQDFNINPSTFWESNDPPGRSGITEIRYIEGLYRYLDYLRDRFPDMIIDNCSSGGRRFDMEMISRSMPLWRTDCHYGEPTCQQCHEYGLSQFLPLHGTGIYYADKYSSRSGLSSAYAWFGEVFDRTNSVADMRRTMDTYKELRNYYLCDFYPLSGDDDITGKDKWIAWQFHDPKTDSGIIQAFRRDDAPQDEYQVALHGLDNNADYKIYNEDNDSTTVISGRELSDRLIISLPHKRSSALLRYRIVE